MTEEQKENIRKLWAIVSADPTELRKLASALCHDCQGIGIVGTRIVRIPIPCKCAMQNYSNKAAAEVERQEKDDPCQAQQP